MSKVTGGLAALAIWLGATGMADAQVNINTTGPSLIYDTDTQCYATATVSGISSYMYNVTIKVNTVAKHNKNYMGSGSSINRLVTGLGAWGMQPGDDFETTIAIGTVSNTKPAFDVLDGISYLPSAPKPSMAPAALKEEELALALATDEEAAA